jgi:UDP-N-acetylmuramoyl-L-alanyl-D-glutamate--2,6-diaminopimelate ligase
MRLEEIVGAIPSAEHDGDPDTEISGLAYDSRKVDSGDLFFCVTGMESDGHEFAPAAVERGAVALVCERETGLGVPEVLVPEARAAMAPAAAAFYGRPTDELKVAGVTGTNGKTTTAFLLRDILESAGVETGLMGTVKQIVGGVDEDVERTTPEAIDLQATFRRMCDAGDSACVIEASSHALVLKRCDSIDFDVAIFTNLTQDHLDFHSDMEDYFAAKRLLFESGPGASVVNIDDPYGRRLAADFDAVTYSAEGAAADYSATGIRFDAAGAAFTVESA